ncbi:FecR domain-containing protein [Methyloceanibacter sp. wino2]|uniref:FecR family protein n=1 Tax=Methyloceanibacter sp. wino2 TaxID=2170729 RepID=UPI00131F173C|nr:FecR domain-containing protein [Methyloceanibacter sp. wino2]
MAIALLCSAGVGLALSAPAYAAKVGVAAAVNPDAFSSLSGVPNKQLNIGKSIFYNERIETTAQGLVQVLLVDGSTFTVGPNSNLVIDKFVYDPNKKTGELVATFSKGSMRFIGGKLSKNAGGVKVNTPSGALAIRGGMFQGNTQKKIYSFLYGHSMSMQGRNGRTQTVYQPGYTLDMSSGTGNVRPTTAEDTNVFMQALSSPATTTSSSSGGGGDSGSQNPNSTAQQSGQQADNVANAASDTISNVTTTQIQTEITKQLIRLEQLKTDPVPMPKVITPPPAIDNTETPTVVKTGGTFNGHASGFLQTGDNGSGEPISLYDGTANVKLDPKANTVTGAIQVNDHRGLTIVNWEPVPRQTTTFNLGFAGQAEAYIDDNTFLAFGNDGTSNVVRKTWNEEWVRTGRWPWQGHFEQSQNVENFSEVSHSGNLISIPGSVLCNECEFIKFGTWASDVTYGSNVDKMGGWWVAGNVVPEANIDKLQQLQASASYEGSAVGTVAKLKKGTWNQYIATGDMTLDWQFAKRSGDFSVKNFDNRNFGGKLVNAPGTSGFTGIVGHVNRNNLAKSIAGTANGSFVGFQGIDKTPKGVIGNFDVRQANDRWRANGIYAGAQR